MRTKQTDFNKMTKAELRAFLNGCHDRRDYDSLFYDACAVYCERFV